MAASSSLHVALLRGINVGGRKMVAMADIRRLLERMGFANVTSILQSGNLIFEGDGRPTSEMERLIEAEAAARLALHVDVFVRSAGEWNAVVAGNPFRQEARTDPGHLVVVCMKDGPDRGKVTRLRAAITGRETVHADGRHLYVVYPDGIGPSRLTNTMIEKTLGTRGTARNWNTALRLHAFTA